MCARETLSLKNTQKERTPGKSNNTNVLAANGNFSMLNSDCSDMPKIDFLQTVVDTKVPLNIFLTNGVKLSGHVIGYDKYTILLKHYNMTSMIYKSAISTILPNTQE